MKIASISDPMTATGLKLAGVGGAHEAGSWEEAEKIFEQLLGEPEMGIIIITETLAEKMDEKLSRFREDKEGVTPVIIEIPDKGGPMPERREAIDKIVKRAVGVTVER